MSNVQVTMLAQQPYTLLRDAVFTPTMTEAQIDLVFANSQEKCQH
jgi:hypothetical protein